MTETDTSPSAGSEDRRPFEAEVSRLLHLMVHSVYSNTDVFLRELVSNAADACEKLRTLALETPELTADGAPFAIRLSAHESARTLTIEDNGVGMSRDELVENLGTIARSGTRAFMEGLEANDAQLIGQFGVGFYSAFMVAEKVDVISRRAGTDEAWRWSSDGAGSYSVSQADLPDAPARGSRVVLHLREDAADYAKQATIERVIAEHSAHVPVPITLAVSGEVDKQLGDGSALWRKPKSDVAENEYAEFYNHVSGQFDEPALTVHFRAEGRHEFSALVFVPSMKPFDLFEPERKGRIRLYVQRVFITAEADILPGWLRFVRGVVDSEDLPLNISREMLQTNPVLSAVGKSVTSRLLSELTKLAESDSEAFAKIWEAFGPVIKEGLYEDPERRDALYELVRFRTTKGDGWRTLKDVVADFRQNQTAIYYALGDSEEAIRATPHLEGLARQGVEVLLLADPVDAFWVRTATGYDGKPFHSVTQGGADLDSIPLADDAAGTDEEVAADSAVATLAALFKQALGDRVSEVKASTRLATSPVCLIAPDMGPDRQLERILSRAGQETPKTAPIMELNPANGLVRSLTERAVAGTDREVLDDAAFVLFGEARILDGEPPDDPADYAARVSRLIARSLGTEPKAT